MRACGYSRRTRSSIRRAPPPSTSAADMSPRRTPPTSVLCVISEETSFSASGKPIGGPLCPRPPPSTPDGRGRPESRTPPVRAGDRAGPTLGARLAKRAPVVLDVFSGCHCWRFGQPLVATLAHEPHAAEGGHRALRQWIAGDSRLFERGGARCDARAPTNAARTGIAQPRVVLAMARATVAESVAAWAVRRTSAASTADAPPSACRALWKRAASASPTRSTGFATLAVGGSTARSSASTSLPRDGTSRPASRRRRWPRCRARLRSSPPPGAGLSATADARAHAPGRTAPPRYAPARRRPA